MEQVWELVRALELYVEFPPLDLPELPDGSPADPVAAARAVRRAWEISPGPLPHLVHLAFVEPRDRLQDLVRHDGFNTTLDREHFYPSLGQALDAINNAAKDSPMPPDEGMPLHEHRP